MARLRASCTWEAKSSSVMTMPCLFQASARGMNVSVAVYIRGGDEECSQLHVFLADGVVLLTLH